MGRRAVLRRLRRDHRPGHTQGRPGRRARGLRGAWAHHPGRPAPDLTAFAATPRAANRRAVRFGLSRPFRAARRGNRETSSSADPGACSAAKVLVGADPLSTYTHRTGRAVKPELACLAARVHALTIVTHSKVDVTLPAAGDDNPLLERAGELAALDGSMAKALDGLGSFV